MSMSKLLLCSLAVASVFAADNPWNKVKELRTGTELRIFKVGGKAPILATMDEADDERLVIVIKKEQQAIEKDQIDRIDYRPTKSSDHRVTTETRTTTETPGQTAGPMPQGNSSGVGPNTSTSSSVNFGGGKADFETIYRRTPMLK